MATTPNTLHRLIYNGIELLLSKFDTWDMEGVFSDDGTTRLYTKHLIAIRGYINHSAQQYPFTTNSMTLQQYRTRLLEPRQSLTVYVNSEKCLEIPAINPFGSGAGPHGSDDYYRGPGDAKQGPTPKVVKVMEWTGATLMVEFVVEAWEYPCAVDTGNPTYADAIIYNRWTQTQDIDADGFSTMTSRGQLKVRTDIMPMADNMRSIPLPIITIRLGFTRDSQKYEISADGSTLTWEVVDKEQYRAAGRVKFQNGSDPGQNITSWTGSWTEEGSIETGLGFVTTGTLQVYCRGEQNTDKDHLLLFCSRVANTRLNQGDIIRYYRFEEGLSDNSLSMTMSVIIYRDNKNVNMDPQSGVASKARLPLAPKSAQSATGSELTRIGGACNFINPIVVNEIQGGDPMPIQIRGSDLPGATIDGVQYRSLVMFISGILPTCDHRTNIWIHTQNQNNPRSSDVNARPVPIGDREEKGYQGVPLNSDTQTKQSTNPYIESRIATQIVENSNQIQLSRANGDTNANCFYAIPTTPLSKKICRFVMSRLNQVPDLPKAQLSGHTLLKNTVVMDEVEVLPSGTDFIYTVRGEYIFGMDKTAQIGLNTIKMPASIISTNNTSSSNNNISANNFVNDLIA